MTIERAINLAVKFSFAAYKLALTATLCYNLMRRTPNEQEMHDYQSRRKSGRRSV